MILESVCYIFQFQLAELTASVGPEDEGKLQVWPEEHSRAMKTDSRGVQLALLKGAVGSQEVTLIAWHIYQGLCVHEQTHK